jgi:Na+/glutamate symporter
LVVGNVVILFNSLGVNLHLQKAKKGWQVLIVFYFKYL